MLSSLEVPVYAHTERAQLEPAKHGVSEISSPSKIQNNAVCFSSIFLVILRATIEILVRFTTAEEISGAAVTILHFHSSDSSK
jgi:hypothetical protein